MNQHPPISSDQLLELLTTMMRIRTFEERVADLVEAREIHTPCHLAIGQEAVATGVCAALAKGDTLWGGHRSHGHYLAKGGDLNALMAEIFCKQAGCSGGRGGSMHIYDADVGVLGTVPLVGATIPLAVGAGLASKLRRDGGVAVAFLGDGATEEGGFHESMNMAAVYGLPVLFVVENNLYASHMHILQRRAQDNILLSASAHGMPGVAVDGNDVQAVLIAARDAVGRAKSGGGPTLIEARTFRWRGHVGPSWDMDVGVKRNDELLAWLPRDPIARARRELMAMGITEDQMDMRLRQVKGEVDVAVRRAQLAEDPSPESLTRHVFATC